MKVFYGIYKLWKGDLNVRNSPSDRFASLSGNILYCWKVGWTKRQWGDFVTIVASDLHVHPFFVNEVEELRLENEYWHTFSYTFGNNKLENYFDYFDLTKKHAIMFPSETIYCLIDLALKREYKQFFNIVYPGLPDLPYNEANPITNLDLFKDCLFVVSDLDKFIKIINNERSTDLQVNQGSKTWRGQINSIQQFLTLFDCDYRNSLWDQINFHKYRGTSVDVRKIEVSMKNYSFQNIHMKRGNVKW